MDKFVVQNTRPRKALSFLGRTLAPADRGRTSKAWLSPEEFQAPEVRELLRIGRLVLLESPEDAKAAESVAPPPVEPVVEQPPAPSEPVTPPPPENPGAAVEPVSEGATSSSEPAPASEPEPPKEPAPPVPPVVEQAPAPPTPPVEENKEPPAPQVPEIGTESYTAFVKGLSYDQLQAECKRRGLPASGKKQILIDSLLET